MTPVQRAIALVRAVAVERGRRGLGIAAAAHRDAQAARRRGEAVFAAAQAAWKDAPPVAGARNGEDLAQRAARREQLGALAALAAERAEAAVAAEARAAAARSRAVLAWSRAVAAREAWEETLARARADRRRVRDAGQEDEAADTPWRRPAGRGEVAR